MMDKLPKLRDSKTDGCDEKLKLKICESEQAKKK
jgi:hypothetical protein